MDRIDALGFRPERLGVFTKELLAEAEDAELQEIVKKAARELSSPIALVSLILDQIQFFKAFVGLPAPLAASRGTHRDASFCQFVVRDGVAFEVNDAFNDPRIPKHVVSEYNIQSYLGVPILVEDVVVGSLCVLDTKKRGFTEGERSSLINLASHVNDRLKIITRNRRQTRLNLSENAFGPVLSELSEALNPILLSIHSGYTAVSSMRSFLDLTKYVLSGQKTVSDALNLSLEAAVKSNQKNEKLLFDIETAAEDMMDCIKL
jgi:transcriptional regulator with GAF, ATPase, and Fis domain